MHLLPLVQCCLLSSLTYKHADVPAHAYVKRPGLGLFILSLLFFYSQNVFANPELINEHNIVKVMSHPESTRYGKLKSYSSGTGFVINDEGYIITNDHVAGNSKALFVIKNGQRVNLSEGFDLKNKSKNTNIEKSPWSSPDLDLAIIRVKPEYLGKLKLQPVTLTRQVPQQSKSVSAVGYPGIADSTSVKTEEIVASSTYSKGEVARVIEDGYWRKGGQSIVQLLHTVPISGGSSGGPLFDECGRVVGVNTAAPTERSKVYDNSGKQIGEGSVSNAAYGWASSINELIEVLDSQGIKYVMDNSVCLSKQEIYEQKNEKLSQILQLTLYVGGAAFLAIGLLLVYMLRNPASRKKMSSVVETYSRSIRRQPPAPQQPLPSRASNNNSHIDVNSQAKPHASVASLILDGYGPNHERFRLVIEAELLFRGDLIVGREPDNRKYAVREDSVSRRHCAFYAQGNDLFIRDMGSTNGTLVDGQKLMAGESRTVQNGAEIKLGSVLFKVIAG